jgi:sulfur carrier protein
VKLLVNGESRDLRDGATVADLVGQVSGGRRGVAVAVNGDVVPRRDWEATRLAAEDRVEVLSAIQGG